MLKCDPRAFARCPYSKQCSDSPEHTSFYAGTECDYFNQQVINKPMTNADRIRAMSDEELANEMRKRSISTICDIVCQGGCKAIATLNKTGNKVCKEIILNWLQQPAKEEEDT